MNKALYNCEEVVKALEEKIKKSIDDLDERELILLLNFKAPNNPFSVVIFTKILDSIDENGEVGLDADTVFKLLVKIV